MALKWCVFFLRARLIPKPESFELRAAGVEGPALGLGAFRVWGLGFRVWGLGFRVQSLWFRV